MNTQIINTFGTNVPLWYEDVQSIGNENLGKE